MQKYASIRNTVFESQKIIPTALTLTEYSTHVLNDGISQDKQEVTKVLGQPLFIHNKSIYSAPLQ